MILFLTVSSESQKKNLNKIEGPASNRTCSLEILENYNTIAQLSRVI